MQPLLPEAPPPCRSSGSRPPRSKLSQCPHPGPQPHRSWSQHQGCCWLKSSRFLKGLGKGARCHYLTHVETLSHRPFHPPPTARARCLFCSWALHTLPPLWPPAASLLHLLSACLWPRTGSQLPPLSPVSTPLCLSPSSLSEVLPTSDHRPNPLQAHPPPPIPHPLHVSNPFLASRKRFKLGAVARQHSRVQSQSHYTKNTIKELNNNHLLFMADYIHFSVKVVFNFLLK